MCQLVGILNIAVTLALVIEPDLSPYRSYEEHGAFTAGHNNLSTVHNASSFANQKLIPYSSKWQKYWVGHKKNWTMFEGL